MDVIKKVCTGPVEIIDNVIYANGICIHDVGDDYNLLYDIVTYSNDVAKFMKKCMDIFSQTEITVLCTFYKNKLFCVKFIYEDESLHIRSWYETSNINDNVFNLTR